MKTRKAIVYASAGVIALTVGVVSGAAFGQVLVPVMPSGVAAADGAAYSEQVTPSYETNDSGLSYGSALDATSPDNEPELIAALATNGKEGYVYKTDLDQADGIAAAESFTSPSEAIAWQEAQEAAKEQAAQSKSDSSGTTIPVYEVDGKTQIGVFEITTPDVSK